MKKKIAGLVSMTAAFTVIYGITSFAGTWISDTNGWRYQWEDGSYQGMGWFTDPETQLEYFMAPDGYMMAGTRVEGYWLDDSGVKHEKTEAEIEAEQRRAERLASRPSPGKDAKEVDEAGKAAVGTGVASSTLRTVYSSEMLNLYDSVFLEAKKGLLKSENKDYLGSISKDNTQTTYYYDVQDRGRVLEGIIWKVSAVSGMNYVPYTAEVNYNRNVVPERADAQYFDEAFRGLMVAALGQEEGQRVYERVMSDAVDSSASYAFSGSTDTGNSYDLSYRNSSVNIKITCSEVVPVSENPEEAAEPEEMQSEFAGEETETEAVSTVITAGASKSGE